MGKMTFKQRSQYYCGRLWKITRVHVTDRDGGFVRYVKQYFKRSAIGAEWQYVRGIVQNP